jgi:hypothetical protein
MTQSRYQELSKSLAEARTRFGAYRSECFFFASQFVRGFIDYTGWPREQIAFEPADGAAGAPASTKIEDAMRLDADAFWHFGLRLTVEEPKGEGSIVLKLRFKKLETRYIISLFGFEDFEVLAPTPEAMQPINEAIVTAVKRHYDYGLRLFLENGGRGLKIPISAELLTSLAKE